MKTVRLMTNTERLEVLVEDNVTPKDILLENDVDFSSAQTHLDGAPLSVAEMNTPIGELIGTSERCIMAVIVKLTNA